MWELRPSVLRLLEWNNARVRRVDAEPAQPRPLDDLPWYQDVAAAYPRIRAEWDAFAATGGDLPLIEEVLGHPDQNEGSYWKMAAFVMLGRPIPDVAHSFPETTAAMLRIPGIRAACWSVLGPGAWIPEHVGENAGCLRFLFTVDGPDGVLTVARQRLAARDGEGVLFDDTVPHAASNPGAGPRVVILCDLLRPLPGLSSVGNRLTQRALHSLTPAYRGSARRGQERFRSLNAPTAGGCTARGEPSVHAR